MAQHTGNHGKDWVKAPGSVVPNVGGTIDACIELSPVGMLHGLCSLWLLVQHRMLCKGRVEACRLTHVYQVC